ncbi:protein containing TonB [mine drainage metagenome]|uniref:Protein containing TonB n=1 Tax=mine drainage metagenome TaxID=410659 RepID=T0ZK03_9ZZZZ
MRQHQQGTVYLLVLVGPDGSVQDVKVDQSSGYRDLDRAAIEAARKWKFNPGSRDGKPVGGWVKVPVQFKLSNLGF